jgi:hypothetical protein
MDTTRKLVREKGKSDERRKLKRGTVKGIEEDQPSWLDTLKEEIEKLK